MTSRRAFVSGGFALAALIFTGRPARGAGKPAITVHRSPT
jgi:hypothetical protein